MVCYVMLYILLHRSMYYYLLLLYDSYNYVIIYIICYYSSKLYMFDTATWNNAIESKGIQISSFQ